MQKQEKVLLKCIVKDCNSHVLVTLKTLDIENSTEQFFNTWVVNINGTVF
ncbi:hypothetical protein [Spiroplasma endosymbiont of Zeiraphera isertana]